MLRYRFLDCELNPAMRSLHRDGREVAIEPKVFDLLRYCVEQRGRFLSRQELLDAVWPQVAVAPSALSRAIKEARRAVGDDGERQSAIVTLHGRGYRFTAEVCELGAEPAAQDGAAHELRETATERRIYSGALESSAHALHLSFVAPRFFGCVRLPEHGTTQFGRGDDCDVRVNGDDVSRRHAEVTRDGPIFMLRDLGSTNGTFVNGHAIARAPIANGDVVRFGDVIGVVLPAMVGDEFEPRELLPGIAGSATLERALRPLRAAPAAAPIVLLGEHGVGKRAIATALHAQDRRPALVVFDGANAGSDPAELLQASDARGGTLLIARLASTPQRSQPALLAAIDRAEALAMRVIATSEEPLSAALERGALDRALYARFEGGTVAEIPPLRRRIEDVPLLLRGLVEGARGTAPTAVNPTLLERLCGYDWPYNVRELEQLAASLLGAHPDQLRATHLPGHVHFKARAQRPNAAAFAGLLDALRTHAGNLTRAAHALGIDGADADRLLGEAYQLDPRAAN